ncbi:MAG: V-type ATPase subunit [Syntrophobacterales bacterium]|nr:MAG: V-type ATPase subunit [Syntrophobacterales bacterium]
METKWRYGDDVRYAYAVGRIRALETRLLTGERVDRMAESGSIDELLRLLGETQYADSFSGLASPWEYEAILDDEMGEVLKLMVELSRDTALTDIFRLRYDFHNLKAALKEKSGGEPLDSAYIALGTIHVERVRDAVRDEEKVRDISTPLRAALEVVTEAFPEAPDPKWIDILIDREMFRTFLGVAMRERCLFLHELLKGEIDLINILSFFRIRWEEGERSFFQEVFLEGGTLSREFLSGLFEENLDAVPSRFSHTPYVLMVTEGLAHLQTQGSFFVFERMREEFLFSYIKRAGLIAFGIEPLIAYHYMKESEIRTIRTIFVGLLNNVPSETIKERISRGFF